MKRGKDETDSKTSGYNRQQKSSTTKEVEQSDSDDVEITISIPISKRRDIDNEEKSSILEKSTSQNAISSSSSSLQNEPNKRKEENPISTSSSPNEELKSLIRSRLSKASGYRADTSYSTSFLRLVLDLFPKVLEKKRSIHLFIDPRKRGSELLQTHLR